MLIYGAVPPWLVISLVACHTAFWTPPAKRRQQAAETRRSHPKPSFPEGSMNYPQAPTRGAPRYRDAHLSDALDSSASRAVLGSIRATTLFE